MPKSFPKSGQAADESGTQRSRAYREGTVRARPGVADPDVPTEDIGTRSGLRDSGRRRPDPTRIAPEPRARQQEPPDDDNATQAGPPITLYVLEGPDAGIRQKVRGGRMVIGRGEGCDLRLGDAACSRRHLELVVGTGGMVLRDLGSGNGTLLNGKRITESAIHHRDQIEIGQTLLQVVDDLKKLEEERSEEEAAQRRAKEAEKKALAAAKAAEEPVKEPEPPVAAPSPIRRNALYVLGGLAALALLILLVGLIGPKKPEGPSREEREYAEYVRAGNLFMQHRDFNGALQRFLAAKELFDRPDLSAPIQQCEREVKAKSALERAKQYADAADWQHAVASLREISEKTVVHPEGQQLHGRYVDEWKKAVYAKVRDALAASDVKAARTMLESLPRDPDVQVLIDNLQKLDKKPAEKPKESDAPRVTVTPRVRRVSGDDVDTVLAAAYRQIDRGDFDGALKELNQILEATSSKPVVNKIRTLRQLVPRFAKAYRAGMGKYSGGLHEAAADLLLSAMTIYDEMDIPGDLGDSLREKTIRALCYKGRAALGRLEYGVAAKAYRRVLEQEQDSPEAKASLRDIAKRANDVLLEGEAQMKRSPEVARRRFQEVMEMVPPSNPAYEAAQARLAEMNDG